MEKKSLDALTKAMALCSKSEMCAFDIERKLSEWGINDEDSLKIVNELKAQRFIDDQRYAESYARDKFRFNHWGKVKIAYQLKGKSIPENIIFDALDGIDQAEYFDQLKEMLKQKSRSVKANSPYEKKAKLIRFAQGRGYGYEDIIKVIG
jgi:regulatory protein